MILDLISSLRCKSFIRPYSLRPNALQALDEFIKEVLFLSAKLSDKTSPKKNVTDNHLRKAIVSLGYQLSRYELNLLEVKHGKEKAKEEQKANGDS